MDLELAGKTAIVTGSSGLIAQAIVLAMVDEGMNVVCASRDAQLGTRLVEQCVEQSAERNPAATVLSVPTDVTQKEAVADLVNTCIEQLGGVDVLVNNAGGIESPAAVAALSESVRRRELALNVDGTVYCCQAVGQAMLARGNGAIVNISSISALLGEYGENIAHYAGVKGFVRTLTRSLAWEWAARGIRVNSIAPGWIMPQPETSVSEGSFWSRHGFALNGTPQEIHARFAAGELSKQNGLPLPRLGTPDDIASCVLFLCSDKASYITGQEIGVCGGAYMA